MVLSASDNVTFFRVQLNCNYVVYVVASKSFLFSLVFPRQNCSHFWRQMPLCFLLRSQRSPEIPSYKKKINYTLLRCTFSGESGKTSVRPSLSWMVGYSLLFCVFYSLTALLLLKGSGDLKYGPCPPARDWGSRVSNL